MSKLSQSSPSQTTAVPESGPQAQRGVRAAGKARSRQRLLDAAKQLFMERGYDGATVREIAAKAGLSTGAVFASFSDKEDLFNAVLLADCPTQVSRMEEAAQAAAGSLAERLTTVISVGYDLQLEQLELMRAALSVSWSQGLTGDLGDRPIRQTAVAFVRQLLEDAVAGGELRGDTDLDLVVEMLWDCYVANYRHALFADFDRDQLNDRFGRQVRLVLASQIAA